jgi:hypothetical protein
LYECDQAGLNCQSIFGKSYSHWYGEACIALSLPYDMGYGVTRGYERISCLPPGRSNDARIINVQLIADPVLNTITLKIYGEVVYTQQG